MNMYKFFSFGVPMKFHTSLKWLEPTNQPLQDAPTKEMPFLQANIHPRKKDDTDTTLRSHKNSATFHNNKNLIRLG